MLGELYAFDEGLSCFLLELRIWWSCFRKLFENSHWTL